MPTPNPNAEADAAAIAAANRTANLSDDGLNPDSRVAQVSGHLAMAALLAQLRREQAQTPQNEIGLATRTTAAELNEK